MKGNKKNHRMLSPFNAELRGGDESWGEAAASLFMTGTSGSKSYGDDGRGGWRMVDRQRAGLGVAQSVTWERGEVLKRAGTAMSPCSTVGERTEKSRERAKVTSKPQSLGGDDLPPLYINCAIVIDVSFVIISHYQTSRVVPSAQIYSESSQWAVAVIYCFVSWGQCCFKHLTWEILAWIEKKWSEILSQKKTRVSSTLGAAPVQRHDKVCWTHNTEHCPKGTCSAAVTARDASNCPWPSMLKLLC